MYIPHNFIVPHVSWIMFNNLVPKQFSRIFFRNNTSSWLFCPSNFDILDVPTLFILRSKVICMILIAVEAISSQFMWLSLVFNCFHTHSLLSSSVVGCLTMQEVSWKQFLHLKHIDVCFMNRHEFLISNIIEVSWL